MKRIYLDYASLTPIDKGVMKEMKKYSTMEYSNPSSLYLSGVKAKKAIEDAKVRIAKLIHAHFDEIVFTSGGTESNNLVLQNKINKQAGKQIIISAIEHSSIINNENFFDFNSANSDSKEIPNVVYILVDKNGVVDLELLKKSITPETTLVSIMLVNNEIGTVEPIYEIAKIVRDARKTFGSQFPLLHTDACQASIHSPLYTEKLGVDLMSLDGHKIYGPRGVGVLYVKRGTMEIERAGTANLPGIMGFAYALELAEKMKEKETARVASLKDFFVNELIRLDLPGGQKISVNGSGTPHILSISIPNIDNEFFILQLDAKGIECSTKSACLRDEDESYVLKAIGVNSKEAVRFSFGRYTTKGDLKKVLKVIKKILVK